VLCPGAQLLQGGDSIRLLGHDLDEWAIATHNLGCRQGKATGEHPEPREECLFMRIQQVVAPGDRGAQRLLARGWTSWMAARP
jgi:hypothetical protein